MAIKVLVVYTLESKTKIDCYDFGFSREDEQITDFEKEVAEVRGDDVAIHYTWVTLPDYIKEGDSWESEEAHRALTKQLAA